MAPPKKDSLLKKIFTPSKSSKANVSEERKAAIESNEEILDGIKKDHEKQKVMLKKRFAKR